jgi:hypothetical protein
MKLAAAESQIRPFDPVGQIRDTLSKYLAEEERSPEPLLHLLEGRGLPPVGDQEEPYIWLLRGLPERKSSHQIARRRLADTLAAILDREPDIQPLGRIPERLLYNLLLLSSSLRCPRELAGSLLQIWYRSQLQGRWQGLDLRVALMDALTANQIDESLWEEWERMLTKKRPRFLPGRPEDGFSGVLWMPVSPNHIGKPNLDKIGKALGYMQEILNHRPSRYEEFERLIQRFQTLYPQCPLGRNEPTGGSGRTILGQRLHEVIERQLAEEHYAKSSMGLRARTAEVQLALLRPLSFALRRILNAGYSPTGLKLNRSSVDMKLGGHEIRG